MLMNHSTQHSFIPFHTTLIFSVIKELTIQALRTAAKSSI